MPNTCPTLQQNPFPDYANYPSLKVLIISESEASQEEASLAESLVECSPLSPGASPWVDATVSPGPSHALGEIQGETTDLTGLALLSLRPWRGGGVQR